MYWLPYSSHTSHHLSQTAFLLWISYATQKLMLDSCTMLQNSLKHSVRFCGFFPSLKQNFIEYRSSKVFSRPDCIFEIHLLWESVFSRVYSNSCCRYSFKPEIIKIGLSSHKMYSNNILNFQESTPILNVCTKKSGNLLNAPHIYKTSRNVEEISIWWANLDFRLTIEHHYSCNINMRQVNDRYR